MDRRRELVIPLAALAFAGAFLLVAAVLRRHAQFAPVFPGAAIAGAVIALAAGVPAAVIAWRSR